MNPERSKRPTTVDGFRRPAPRNVTPQLGQNQTPVSNHAHPVLHMQPLSSDPSRLRPLGSDESLTEKKPLVTPVRPKRVLKIVLLTLAVLIICVLGATYGWYRHELSPLNSAQTKTQNFTVKQGATPHQIADNLEKQHLVHSASWFYIYLTVTHQRNILQAGTYAIAPSMSVEKIVHDMSNGAVTDVSVTFYPGATLDGTLRSEPKYSVTTQLKNAGFSADAIQQAFTTRYGEPVLFASKPAGTSLEGYIYGDTYDFSAGTSATDVVKRGLDEFSTVVAKNNLVALYKKQHLSLYQGITLASIVEREIDSSTTQPTQDQRQVAQIFLSRLKKHMTLGSDVTFLYGAEKLGVTPSPSVDSPYNTRKYPGLPPGPIAVPGLSALLAVAHPANTDYLYFLSGDNGTTYFSKTADGHQQNIQNHCVKKCQD